MCLNPCNCIEPGVQKQINYMKAQRLGRGQELQNEDPGCVSCPHLQVLIDKIVELQDKVKLLAGEVIEASIPFNTVG
jgi:hypothetical protein